MRFVPDVGRHGALVHGLPELDGTRAYVGLFTHILGHANWEHLLGNFMLILLIGPILEERHGSLGAPRDDPRHRARHRASPTLAFVERAVIGASGVVFMMILLASIANVRGGEIPLTFIAVAVIYMGGEIVALVPTISISHMAHLDRRAVGAAFGFLGAAAAGKGKAKPIAPTHDASPGRASYTKKSGNSGDARIDRVLAEVGHARRPAAPRRR